MLPPIITLTSNIVYSNYDINNEKFVVWKYNKYLTYKNIRKYYERYIIQYNETKFNLIANSFIDKQRYLLC